MNYLMTSIKYIFCKEKEDVIHDLRRESYKSSYKKQIMDSNKILYVNKFGFENDVQSDKLHHGGIDKAVCIYPLKYYTYFKKKYNIDLPLCAFGENITIKDLDDSDFCIGDKWKCGEVIFEVSQPRQPCWKISSMIGIKNLTSLVVKNFKTGFYFRVIEKGKINSNDKLVLITRQYPKLNIEYINKCAYNANLNQENIKEILDCAKLANAYSLSLSKRYKEKEQGLQEWQEDDYNK